MLLERGLSGDAMAEPCDSSLHDSPVMGSLELRGGVVGEAVDGREGG